MCVAVNEHQTYQQKSNGRRYLYDAQRGMVEVDIMNQRETSELAPIVDTETALAAVNRAGRLGLFPDKASPEQAQLLAEVALAYRLDPLMGEIIPFQGRPYITIAGRRRLDNAAGNAVSVSFRPPTESEQSYYVQTGVIGAEDFIQICVGYDPKTTATVEGFGRVLARERSRNGRSAGAIENLPTIQRTIEMAQKRAERRMREQMFGPVAKPVGLRDIVVYEEGDNIDGFESSVQAVEGASKLVEDEDDATILGQGELGLCREHPDSPWIVSESKWGAVQASHKIEGTSNWCRFGIVHGEFFRQAYVSRYGDYKKGIVDAWLKDNFGGRTWSKLEPKDMLRAISLLKDTPDGSQGAISKPSSVATIDDRVDELPALETAADVEFDGSTPIITSHLISEEQQHILARLAQEIDFLRFMEYVSEITGNPHPDMHTIPTAFYNNIIEWVNSQIDQQVIRKDH